MEAISHEQPPNDDPARDSNTNGKLPWFHGVLEFIQKVINWARSSAPAPSNAKQILIIGREGNGKRSIGNSILGKKLFKPSNISQQNQSVNYQQEGDLKIIICPFTGDTEQDSNNISQDRLDAKKRLETYSQSGGFHAIVFALKYGVRFTKQEKDAVTNAKRILGEHVVRDHVILAFSYGDLFESDQDEIGLSFEEWCAEQTGDIQDLFKEVGKRYVIFNNKWKEVNEIKAARETFFKLVQGGDSMNDSSDVTPVTKIYFSEDSKKCNCIIL